MFVAKVTTEKSRKRKNIEDEIEGISVKRRKVETVNRNTVHTKCHDKLIFRKNLSLYYIWQTLSRMLLRSIELFIISLLLQL